MDGSYWLGAVLYGFDETINRAAENRGNVSFCAAIIHTNFSYAIYSEIIFDSHYFSSFEVN